ncbi:MAG: hypothetical protein ACD_46C00518G0001 [uncultured bacterium]|nr:MAG: hypothetical protein ACD_46C00518G0001 [uncultured bacterium]
MTNCISSLKKTNWATCREKVKLVNPTLANIIDSLSPDHDMALWLVKYPFGATIDDGKFYYPTPDGKLVLLDDSRLEKNLQTDFSYAGSETPAGIVLKNTMEIFIETDDRIIPQALFMPGDIFALWGRLETQTTFHPSPLMRGTAGARSLLMIPNISDLTHHKKLRNEFNLRLPPPKNMIDQWHIFKTIVNQTNDKWHTEALLFTGTWLNKIKTDTAFQPLYIYFLEQAWRNSAYWRNKVFYDYIFSCVQQKRNLKPNPYLADTMKYLITMAVGSIPGFGAAKDNIAGPVELLQKIYVDCYGLKKYAPTMMHPVYFHYEKNCDPVYYSLQCPTTFEFSPRSRKASNILYDLIELKHILDIFLQEISRKKLNIEHGVMSQIAENVRFDFFHSKPDRHGEILSTRRMQEEDLSLTKNLNGDCHQPFADAGAFVRGCVRLSNQS